MMGNLANLPLLAANLTQFAHNFVKPTLAEWAREILADNGIESTDVAAAQA